MRGSPPGNQLDSSISLKNTGVAALPISVSGSISCPMTMSTKRLASFIFCECFSTPVRQLIRIYGIGGLTPLIWSACSDDKGSHTFRSSPLHA